jgi:hypothetical protein
MSSIGFWVTFANWTQQARGCFIRDRLRLIEIDRVDLWKAPARIQFVLVSFLLRKAEMAQRPSLSATMRPKQKS